MQWLIKNLSDNFRCYRCYQVIQKPKIKTLGRSGKIKKQLESNISTKTENPKSDREKPEWPVFQREKEREKKVHTCERGDWW